MNERKEVGGKGEMHSADHPPTGKHTPEHFSRIRHLTHNHNHGTLAQESVGTGVGTNNGNQQIHCYVPIAPHSRESHSFHHVKKEKLSVAT